MGLYHLLLLFLAAFSHVVLADQIFGNHGTLDGWSTVFREHKGTVNQVSNISYRGTTALKMTQTYDNYGGRYHSEVRVSNGYNYGDTHWYGFAFRLSENWVFGNHMYNLAQFIGNMNGHCDDWMPSTMLWVKGNTLYTRRRFGDVCNRPSTTDPIPVGTVPGGTWYKVLIQARWTNDATGFLKIWLDDNLAVNQDNVATTVVQRVPFEFRVGIYANGWHDEKTQPVNEPQPFRQVWFDEIAIATTRGEAEPGSW
jgi:hypothetical protein